MVALLVFAVGLGATLYYWENLNRSVRVDMDAAFAKQVENTSETMKDRIHLYEQFLRGGGGLVSIHPDLTQAEWEAYFRPYNFIENYPDVEGVGVNTHLPAADVGDYLDRQHEQGSPNFAITPAGERDVYMPITFDAQYTGNNGTARGFDAYTDPVRREAMDRAVETNRMTMSGKTNLVSASKKNNSSFIFYSPVYHQGRPTKTVEERKAALLGFVYIAIDSPAFVTTVLKTSQSPHLGLQLYDAEGEAQKVLVYESDNFDSITRTAGAKVESATIELYGHRWQAMFAASSDLISARERQLPGQALWRGIITCIFFAGLVWYLITDRERTYARQKHEEVQTAKDDLLSLASHQLRTPATVVKQYVGMLLQGYAGKLSEQQLDMLTNAYESNERQLEIINQLLYVARLDAGRITLHTRKTDITKMMHDAARDQSGVLSERKQQLSFRLPKQAITAEIDPHYMRMVLDNLINNAVKYTPENGSITLELKRSGGNIFIKVHDTGVGIDAAVHENIFEKFTRAENELSTDVNGSGVGLYLTKEIVELHHGEIGVVSAVGEGSTFTIRIPVHQPKTNADGQMVDL